MQYFGITETFDPAQDYSWVNQLKVGNILITKHLTDKLIDIIIQPNIQSRCILHLTITGWGDTILEPNVPTIEESYIQFKKLISLGFSIEQIVLRISPIVPVGFGLDKVINVLDTFKDSGIRRIRFSTLNMYDHVKRRFKEANIINPYNTYSCTQQMRDNLINLMLNYFKIETKETWDKDICAEIDLDEGLILKRGCLSQKDLEILNLQNIVTLEGKGRQRSSCMCPDNKRQIIMRKDVNNHPIFGRCDHQCLYCYWKD